MKALLDKESVLTFIESLPRAGMEKFMRLLDDIKKHIKVKYDSISSPSSLVLSWVNPNIKPKRHIEVSFDRDFKRKYPDYYLTNVKDEENSDAYAIEIEGYIIHFIVSRSQKDSLFVYNLKRADDCSPQGYPMQGVA